MGKPQTEGDSGQSHEVCGGRTETKEQSELEGQREGGLNLGRGRESLVI